MISLLPAHKTWQSQIEHLWSSEAPRKRLLVVDDDLSLLGFLEVLFEDEYDVRAVADGLTALATLNSFAPDAIILDLEMPGMDGRKLYNEIRTRGLSAPVLILSAFGAESGQRELGAEAHFNKPFAPDALLQAVSRLLAR